MRVGTPHLYFPMEQGSVTLGQAPPLPCGRPLMAFPALEPVAPGGLWRQLLENPGKWDLCVQAPCDGDPCLFQMHFIFSDEAVLLFDFWRVHSPTGKNWEGQTYSLQARQQRTWVLFIFCGQARHGKLQVCIYHSKAAWRLVGCLSWQMGPSRQWMAIVQPPLQTVGEWGRTFVSSSSRFCGLILLTKCSALRAPCSGATRWLVIVS